MKFLLALWLTTAPLAAEAGAQPAPAPEAADMLQPAAEENPAGISAEPRQAEEADVSLLFPEQPAGLSQEQPAGLSDAVLREIDRLTAAGAANLALEVLGENQPEYAVDPDGWRQYEQVRVDILRRTGQWQRLAEHLTRLPDNLELADARPLATLRAQALLESGKPRDALAVLRGLIWSGTPVSETEMRHWRRQVIRAWREADELDHARTAIQRFQQDYSEASREWQMERGRLALLVMAPEEARAILNGLKGADAEILQLIAGLWSGSIPPAQVVENAVKLGVDKELSEALRRDAWAAAAEAAGMLNNTEARIAALERALVLESDVTQQPVVPVTADDLWNAYLQFGEKIGNKLQLIIGDDEAWFLAASNHYDKQPIHARALFAVVALKAFREDQAAVAHWQLASLLDERVPMGGALMRALYLESSRFPEAADVPAAVRYLLLDHVLAIPDIPLASELVKGLDQPPQETDPAEWQLRRARVLLLGGKMEEGIRALELLFQTAETFDRDRVLQVVFDLQTLGRHEAALAFLEKLQAGMTEAQPARELWYWRADSLSALGRHADAARAYLMSALLQDPYVMDPWAQTARFRAAEALTEAGYYADAREQFQALLNSTRDEGRQAVLRNHLQELRLLEQKAALNAGSEPSSPRNAAATE